MEANVYELMLILDPNAYAKDPGGMANLVKNMIENHGGTVLANRLWNEQRLAYPINGHRKGVYWLAYFSMKGPELAKIERECVITDSIIRHLAIKIDPRLTETLVAMALGERPMRSLASEIKEPIGADSDE
ncbi:MAG: 30S ribosomal protein S6 [Planctomycetaceae bacterium]|nr:30S ribosomal protein S6 [Planctomycetaceae bacterium]